ncbi:MAG: hypothetical protein QOI21_3667 [Actinomycetota bacterium]|jgi:hypothetical protein|nr:hypothetical protein [Actinomycetota bacterium]
MTINAVRHALRDILSDDAECWLAESMDAVAAEPAKIRALFPAAGRKCGRGPLTSEHDALRGWTVDDAVRVLLLSVLSTRSLVSEVHELYRYGDASEKRAVIRGLAEVPIGSDGLPLVRDALRTNDTRLVAAALGRYGSEHLDAPAYRHGVLKCVFMGIPLADISGLADRADPELTRMLRSFAEERLAAGRPVPADVGLLVPEFSDLEA